MKFSVRDLFLVTVIVALAVGWWLDHRKNAALDERLNEMASIIENLMLVIDPPPRQKFRANGGDNWLPTSSAPAPNPPKDRQ
jgi:hypothetical protein